MKRAIWSAPPPVPAGMMKVTGFVGSHALAARRRKAPQSRRDVSASAIAADFECLSSHA